MLLADMPRLLREIVMTILGAEPDLMVVADCGDAPDVVIAGGHSAHLYVLRPTRYIVADLSPETLLAAVRRA